MLFTMFTRKERRHYRKDRRVNMAPPKSKTTARVGIKEWIIQNKPTRLQEMVTLGLIKKESIYVDSKASPKKNS